MKNILQLLICISLSGCAYLKQPVFLKQKQEPVITQQKLNVEFVDINWGGQLVPNGQQCQKYGGKGASPSLKVKGLTSQANAVLVTFSDKSKWVMGKGSNGKIGIRIKPNQRQVYIPSIKENVTTLPKEMFSIDSYSRKFRIDGVYLPPCSKGKKHDYFATVESVIIDSENNVVKVLDVAEIYMGQY